MSAHTPAGTRAGHRSPCRHRTVLGSHTIPAAANGRFSDDDLLLFLLTSTWQLYTARPAPPVPPEEMTEEELIEYWSDPAYDEPSHSSATGGPAAREELAA